MIRPIPLGDGEGVTCLTAGGNANESEEAAEFGSDSYEKLTPSGATGLPRIGVMMDTNCDLKELDDRV